MKLLDLAKFEKVKEDKDTTTMRHADGHEMTILHSRLPKIQREQLKRLKMAAGGQVAHYDDGTPDAPVSSSDAGNDQAPDHSTTINISASPPQAAAPAPAQQTIPGSMPISQESPANTLSQSVPYVNVPAVPNTKPNIDPNTGQENLRNVAQNAQTAASLGADVSAAKAQAENVASKQYNASLGQTDQMSWNNLQDMNARDQAFAQYNQQNPIDPQHWAESQTTAQKVLNAMGLLAGGFTGGFNGTGVNPAMNYINQQIDRDIQAQYGRQAQQKSILGAYSQIYGNTNQALDATKMAMTHIYANNMNQIADQLGTPQAQAAKIGFQAQMASTNQLAMRNAITNISALPGGSPQSAPGSAAQGVSPSLAPRQQAGSVSTPGASGAWDDTGVGGDLEQQNSPFMVRPGIYQILKNGPGGQSPEDTAAALGNPNNMYGGSPLQAAVDQARQIERVLNGANNDGNGGIHQYLSAMYNDIDQGKSMAQNSEMKMGTGDASLPFSGSMAHTAEMAAEAMVGGYFGGPVGALGGAAMSTLGKGAAEAGEAGARGGAIGNALRLIGAPKFIDYVRNYDALMKSVQSGLSGPNGAFTPTQAHGMLADFVPTYKDTPKTMAMSENKMADNLIRQVPTTLLTQARLWANPKKRK